MDSNSKTITKNSTQVSSSKIPVHPKVSSTVKAVPDFAKLHERWEKKINQVKNQKTLTEVGNEILHAVESKKQPQQYDQAKNLLSLKRDSRTKLLESTSSSSHISTGRLLSQKLKSTSSSTLKKPVSSSSTQIHGNNSLRVTQSQNVNDEKSSILKRSSPNNLLIKNNFLKKSTSSIKENSPPKPSLRRANALSSGLSTTSFSRKPLVRATSTLLDKPKKIVAASNSLALNPTSSPSAFIPAKKKSSFDDQFDNSALDDILNSDRTDDLDKKETRRLTFMEPPRKLGVTRPSAIPPIRRMTSYMPARKVTISNRTSVYRRPVISRPESPPSPQPASSHHIRPAPSTQSKLAKGIDEYFAKLNNRTAKMPNTIRMEKSRNFLVDQTDSPLASTYSFISSIKPHLGNTMTFNDLLMKEQNEDKKYDGRFKTESSIFNITETDVPYHHRPVQQVRNEPLIKLPDPLEVLGLSNTLKSEKTQYGHNSPLQKISIQEFISKNEKKQDIFSSSPLEPCSQCSPQTFPIDLTNLNLNVENIDQNIGFLNDLEALLLEQIRGEEH